VSDGSIGELYNVEPATALFTVVKLEDKVVEKDIPTDHII
jgi:hypothetical protein